MSYSIMIPSISDNFEDFNQVPKVIGILRTKYEGIINNTADLVQIDKNIIYGFIFVESKGKADAINGKACGLMQINPDTANLTIVRENLNKGLTEDEINYLRTYLGDRLNEMLSLKYTWKPVKQGVTKADLFEPEFNILIGAMFIKQLMYKTKDNNNIRLDRVIWKYNKGEFAKMPTGDTETLYSQAGATTGKYIRTLLGVNGVLNQLNT